MSPPEFLPQFVVPFVVSLIISLALIPVLRRLSFRIGWVAQVRSDRWGMRSVPTLGGAGIFVSFWIGLIISDPFCCDKAIPIWIYLGCGLAMFILGIYDDAKEIKPPAKLFWQLAAATLVIFLGDTRIDFFPSPIANILLTYLWIVGIANAINLLDNMDGLAGGVAIIASGILGYFFWQGEQYFLLQIVMALCGAILGFLIFNFPPARIFMGNNGSMFLGFLLAVLSIARKTQASNVLATFGVPILIMLMPIIDTSFVMITRLLRGQSPILGGTDHTSHRLIAFGLSERQVVIALYIVALLSGLAAAGLESLDYDLSMVLIPLMLIVIALFTAYLGKIRIVAASPINKPAIERLVGIFTYKRKLFEILIDLIIIGFSYYLAYWTKNGLTMTSSSMSLFMVSWPFALCIAYVAYAIFGVYKGVWGYLGASDLVRYGWASLGAGVCTWVALLLLYPERSFPGDVFIIFSLYLIMGLAGSRSSFQIFDQIYNRQQIMQAKVGVLIYGVDAPGELALSWLTKNSKLGYRPLGFIDNKPQNWGRQIHNVKIFGDEKQVLGLITKGAIKGVILTSSTQIEGIQGSQLLATCQEYGVWVRLLKLELEDI